MMKTSKSNAIILCLERLVRLTFERMPYSTDAHLPFKNKKLLYEIFVQEFIVLRTLETAPTFATFISIWKHQFSSIKIRKPTRFEK